MDKKLKLCVIKRLITSLALVIALFGTGFGNVYANVSYETYTYNYWGDDVRQPHVYLYRETLDNRTLGTTLSHPQDMMYSEGTFFIADTNNSRVLKISSEGKVLMELTQVTGEDDLLKKPQGVFAAQNGNIFVADTDNGRVVEYTAEGVYLRQVGRPDTNLIADSQEYKPVKVVVDPNGSMYVIAFGINMGLVEFSDEGVFQGFIGAVKVQVNPFEYMWKTYFSTKEQRDRMQTFIPTEYSSIFLDKNNFIYATISNISSDSLSSAEADVVRRLNPMGKDVLRRLGRGSITGDHYIGFNADRSVFVDCHATEFGVYFVLDKSGGKVFAYDSDGNVLFAFGAKGNKVDTVSNAIALSLSENNEELYILDSTRGSVLIFDITDYGKHLLTALKATEEGDSETSGEEWKQVLQTNANSELAYIGIGKEYLATGDYRAAMEYFKLGNSRPYYSKAFYYYRKAWMEENFSRIMAILIGLVILIILFFLGKRLKRWVGEIRCVVSGL